MKIIEKQSAVIAYVCELCNTEYDDKCDAENCEKYHVNTVGFTSKEFVNKYSKYPDSVSVRMNDTSIQKYSLTLSTPNDILQNVTVGDGTTNLAIVNSYKVIIKKEYTNENGELILDAICGASVTLQDKKLYVNIPDDVLITSDMNICVKVTDKDGNEVTETSENSPFNDIVITAEVTQTLENDCKETE